MNLFDRVVIMGLLTKNLGTCVCVGVYELDSVIQWFLWFHV